MVFDHQDAGAGALSVFGAVSEAGDWGDSTSAALAARWAPGRRTVNWLPRFCPSLAAVTVPPCNSTSRRTSVRPIPKPPWER